MKILTSTGWKETISEETVELDEVSIKLAQRAADAANKYDPDDVEQERRAMSRPSIRGLRGADKFQDYIEKKKKKQVDEVSIKLAKRAERAANKVPDDIDQERRATSRPEILQLRGGERFKTYADDKKKGWSPDPKKNKHPTYGNPFYQKKKNVAEGSLEEVSLALAKKARDKAEKMVDTDYDDMRDRPYGYSDEQRRKFQRYIDKKEPRAKGDRDWDPPEQGKHGPVNKIPEEIDYEAFLEHVVLNYPELVEEFLNKDAE
jgi:hypothetical protein